MKKMLFGLTAAALLFPLGAAFATDDAASLYQTRCQSCHGPDGGRAPAPGVNPVKGQSSDTLLKMLEGFKDGTFGGAQKQIMEGITHQLSDDQMKSLADYISTL